MTEIQLNRLRAASNYKNQQLQITEWFFDQKVKDSEGSHDDLAKNTDAFLSDGSRICFRVMKELAFNLTPTHLCFRKTSVANEFKKFQDGYGDYYLYCYDTDDSGEIGAFYIVDLKKLREEVKTCSGCYWEMNTKGDEDKGGIIVDLILFGEAILAATNNHKLQAVSGKVITIDELNHQKMLADILN